MLSTHRCWPLVLALLSAAAAAQNGGLVSQPPGLGGAVWQARFERDSVGLQARSHLLMLGLPATDSQAVRLFSDYQLSTLRLGETGGLRLTGGLLINLRPGSALGSSNDSSTQPYAGIGYASGSLRGDWGFSADVGLAAQGLGSARLDRLFNGNGGLSVDGSLRLLPMIRLGVSMAF